VSNLSFWRYAHRYTEWSAQREKCRGGHPGLGVDRFGNRVVGTTLEVRRTQVPAFDMIVHTILWDGREVYASPGHPPVMAGVSVQLKAGDPLDHSQ